MSKTQKTKDIEVALARELYFGNKHPIFECTIGRYGIVDVISHESKLVKQGRGKPQLRENIWRCFEIKVSKSDFYSKSKWTFVGHYNYFVMPVELYPEVMGDIPDGVGVYLAKTYPNGVMYLFNEKRAKKRQLKVDESVLLHEYAVSASRETMKLLENTEGLPSISNDKLVTEVSKRINKNSMTYYQIDKLMTALYKKHNIKFNKIAKEIDKKNKK